MVATDVMVVWLEEDDKAIWIFEIDASIRFFGGRGTTPSHLPSRAR